MMVAQLQAFNLPAAASAVANATGLPLASVAPSQKLLEYASLGQKQKNESIEDDDDENDDDLINEDAEFGHAPQDTSDASSAGTLVPQGPHLDELTAARHEAHLPPYQTWFITAHKSACRTACFSADGTLCATGSSDSSLKVMDVSKLNAKNEEDKPVIRTLYDHTAAVNDAQFHPNGMVLASCSDDCNVKFYDITKPGTKRAFRYIQVFKVHYLRGINVEYGDRTRTRLDPLHFIPPGTIWLLVSLHFVAEFERCH